MTNTMRSSSSRRPESVRPTICRRSLAGGDDEWGAELAEPGIECLLPDCRFDTQPLHVGDEVLADGFQAIAFGDEANDVVAGRRDADALAERQEGHAEDDHDRREGDADGRRPAAVTPPRLCGTPGASDARHVGRGATRRR